MFVIVRVNGHSKFFGFYVSSVAELPAICMWFDVFYQPHTAPITQLGSKLIIGDEFVARPNVHRDLHVYGVLLMSLVYGEKWPF